MSDPKRLLDDPAAPDELRAALALEVERAAAWDPAMLGARVAGALSPAAVSVTAAPAGAAPLGAAALFGPKALVVAAVVGAALGAAGHAALQPRASVTAPVAQTPVAAAPAPPAPAPSPARPVALSEAPLATAEKAPPAPRSSGASTDAPRPVASRGALVDELRLYERGEAALLEGHFEVAVRELQRYLDEHPRGTLRAEAELALVQALARAGRCDEALARAERGAPAAHRKALLAATAACAKSR